MRCILRLRIARRLPEAACGCQHIVPTPPPMRAVYSAGDIFKAVAAVECSHVERQVNPCGSPGRVIFCGPLCAGLCTVCLFPNVLQRRECREGAQRPLRLLHTRVTSVTRCCPFSPYRGCALSVACLTSTGMAALNKLTLLLDVDTSSQLEKIKEVFAKLSRRSLRGCALHMTCSV